MGRVAFAVRGEGRRGSITKLRASRNQIISQSKLHLVVDDNSVFSGQKDTRHTVYDFTGKPVTNTSIMAGKATARSYWEGAQLVTEWESAGEIACNRHARRNIGVCPRLTTFTRK